MIIDEEVKTDELPEGSTVEGQGEELPPDTDTGQPEGLEVPTFEDQETESEKEEQAAPQWVKELRKQNKEDKKRIKALEQELAAKAEAEKKPAEIGPKPTLEGCDYDADVFESRLIEWTEQKRKVDEAKKAEADAAEATKKDFQVKLEGYAKLKSEIKAPDFDESENEVTATLSQTQQGVIVQYAANPAALVYALGKNESKLKALAAIKDPIAFALEMKSMEAQVKTTKRNPPPPEKVPESAGRGIGGAVESQLERLREEAEKTGDYSKVVAFKNQQRNK